MLSLRRNTRAYFLLLLLSTAGCAVQMGAHGGATRAADGSVAATWAGNASASTLVGRQDGVLLGWEVEGRAQHELGSRWTTGAQVGYGWQPDQRRGALGFEAHLDAGTPLKNETLFANGSFYLGPTAALRIWISETHGIMDQNVSQWLLNRAPELVIYGRSRFHFDHVSDDAGGERWLVRPDYVAGLALKLRVVSDFF